MSIRGDKPEAIGVSLGAWSWALYEWARNPYIGVCFVYVFAPYVALTVIGDAAKGQVYLAVMNLAAALVTCLLAPLLGAAADRAGRRKLPLAVLTLCMVFCVALLWFVSQDHAISRWLWAPLMLGAAIAFPLTEAVHNAMISKATSASTVSGVSGLGLALGGAATLLLLLFVLIFIALPGTVDWPGIPATPAFGLDPAAYEPQRVVPLICAAWMLVFTVPLMLFTKDAERGMPWRNAVREGARSLRRLFPKLRAQPDMARFLFARMFFADGVTAILIGVGVYGAAVMQWRLQQMTMYGILISCFAVLGGFAAAALDRALGTKRAIQLQLATLIFGVIALSSFQHDVVGWVIHVGSEPVWSGPFFRSAPELAYLGVMALITLSGVGLFATSRTMLVRLAPPSELGEFFGLYSLAGTATAWLGPLLVALATTLARAYKPEWALQIGMGSIALLLLAGLALISTVRPTLANGQAHNAGDLHGNALTLSAGEL